jgi:hypothetical protein
VKLRLVNTISDRGVPPPVLFLDVARRGFTDFYQICKMDLHISLYFLFISSSLPQIESNPAPAALLCSDCRRPPLFQLPPSPAPTPPPSPALAAAGLPCLLLDSPLAATGIPCYGRCPPQLGTPPVSRSARYRGLPLIRAADLPCAQP